MQSAKVILTVIQERGRRGLPLERIYRQLFNRDLYLLAYGRIYRNQGAMTPGSTTETVDGMSLAKIDTIIDALRHERYHWTPVRRTYIAKKHSTKQRPLGLPSWSDKLLQEVIRLILEAYFEPQFSDHSHGFRPGRGCHTALREIQHTWTGTAWFIEGDIAQCFDTLDHSLLLTTLSKHIHDNRFVHLIGELLKAGYLENWKYNRTLSGTPQGSVVSPILSNIYLDRLDKYIEQVLLPAHNRGSRRRTNRAYQNLNSLAHYHAQRGNRTTAVHLRKLRRKLPSIDPNDPHYRRLHYIRYADDFLLGFCGPREEAEEIKQQLGLYLNDDLKLKLSDQKTLITHARTATAHFLGYEVHTIQENHLCDETGRRTTNGTIGLRIPVEVTRAKCAHYMRHGKPIHRMELTHNTAFSIVAQYQQEYRGIVEYYRLAYNLSTQFSRLRWVMETSLTKTLAHKFRISVARVYKRYGTTIETSDGPRKALQIVVMREDKPPLITQWGGISLKRKREAILDDTPQPIWNTRTELVQRLLTGTCELCGKPGMVVHHIRALKDLRRKGRAKRPRWVEVMAARQRKTLVVCNPCHYDIHAGRVNRSRTRVGER